MQYIIWEKPNDEFYGPFQTLEDVEEKFLSGEWDLEEVVVFEIQKTFDVEFKVKLIPKEEENDD